MQQTIRFGALPYRRSNYVPGLELLETIKQVGIAEAPELIYQIVEGSYPWFSHANYDKGNTIKESILLALKLNLPTPLQAHLVTVGDLLAEDMVGRICSSGGPGFGSYRYADGIACTKYPQYSEGVECFVVPNPKKIYPIAQTSWGFIRLDQYRMPLPLCGLEALDFLREQQLEPQAYWVAEHVGTYPNRPIYWKIDTTLCIQVGLWFAGLVTWRENGAI